MFISMGIKREMINSIVLCAGVVLFASVTLCNAKCGEVFGTKVTESDRKTIVNHHNYLRGLISQGKINGQPKAKNLGRLKWDAALAREAQQIANTCVFAHVKVKDKRFYVGQNLGWEASTAKKGGAEWKNVIQRWFDEQRNFTYPNQSRGMTGHYTQVVWANTNYVGCGYTWYRGDSKWYEKLYVCNYGPGGNYVGEAPYKI